MRKNLSCGVWAASYKFALLLALADLSIEAGNDSGAALELTTEAIAEKFIQYYWWQVIPYAKVAGSGILQQNRNLAGGKAFTASRLKGLG